jgi:hypothetical protein
MNQSLLDSKQTNAGTAATYPYLYSKYTVLEIKLSTKICMPQNFIFNRAHRGRVPPICYSAKIFTVYHSVADLDLK